jgi:hypothetical protein
MAVRMAEAPCSFAGMVALGSTVQTLVASYKSAARCYFYQVMLSGYACPRCGAGLEMLAESRCRCRACAFCFDPTIAFQRCPACDGQPRLRVRHYECRYCHGEIVSRFLFDGMVFDTAYFRRKMVESRQRRKVRREERQEILAENRSPALLPGAADLTGMAGLVSALDGLAGSAMAAYLPVLRQRFDLKRYETHVQAHLRPDPVSLNEIPPLTENLRLDRVGRFIAIIFLAHDGLLHVWQEQTTIWVRAREAHSE